MDPLKNDKLVLFWQDIDLKIRVPNKDNKDSQGDKNYKELNVLQKVNGYAQSGECLAIMGSSGAGKSTLLNLLANRMNIESSFEYQGNVQLNGEAFTWKAFRNVTGFVMQRDIFEEHLKVKEILQFVIDLLGKGKSKEEKLIILNHLIQDLKLNKAQDNLVGGEFNKGISGGEKRRLNIAFELAKSPWLLFLDEPTSGLDSFTSFLIIKLLWEMAWERNMIIIYSIHQPTQEIAQLFDRLMFLKAGRVIFFDYFNNLEVTMKTLDIQVQEDLSLIEQMTEQVQLQDLEMDQKFFEFYKESETGQNFVEQKIKSVEQVPLDTKIDKLSFFEQFKLLFSREVIEFIRNPITFKIRMFQIVFIALIFILLYWRMDEPNLNNVASIKNWMGALYFLSINILVIYMQNSLATFPKNQLIFVKEYDSGLYDVTPYYLSKISIELLFTSIFPIIFVSLIYFLINLNFTAKSFFTLFGGAILYVQVATILGIFVGTIVRSSTLAVEIAPAIFVPLMLFSGFTNNTNNIWVGLKWIEYISPVRYFFEFSVTNEFEDRTQLGIFNPIITSNFTFGLLFTALMLLALYGGLSILSIIFLYRGAQKGIVN